MTEEVSLEHALIYIGYGFTARWIADQKDPKLDGFITSAECCRKDSRRFYKQILFAIAMSAVAAGSAYGAAHTFHAPMMSNWWIGVLVCSIIAILSAGIGAMLVFCLIPDAYPGRTKLRIAWDWEKWRKSALRTRVAMRLADNIRLGEPGIGISAYSLQAAEDAVGDIVHCRLAATAQDVKTHENGGFERRRKKARALFSDLQLLAHVIGIKIKPTGYYYGK